MSARGRRRGGGEKLAPLKSMPFVESVAAQLLAQLGKKDYKRPSRVNLKYSQGSLVGERAAQEVRQERYTDGLGSRGVNGDEFEFQRGLHAPSGACHISNPLRECISGNPVAAERRIDSHAVIQVVPGDSLGHEIGVIVWILVFNLNDFGTSKALPVKADRVEESSEFCANQVAEFNCVRRYKDALYPIFFQRHERCRNDVLEIGIAVREPTLE